MNPILYGNAIVGQSGEPTAAIHALFSGTSQGAMAHMGNGGRIDRLYGMRNG